MNTIAPIEVDCPSCGAVPGVECRCAAGFTHVARKVAADEAYTLRRLAEEDSQPEEGPTCSICDGLGHGYPGGGPCPLEMADYSNEPWWAV